MKSISGCSSLAVYLTIISAGHFFLRLFFSKKISAREKLEGTSHLTHTLPQYKYFIDLTVFNVVFQNYNCV